MCTSFYFVNGTPYTTIRGVDRKVGGKIYEGTWKWEESFMRGPESGRKALWGDLKVGGKLYEGTWKWGQALLENWKENIVPTPPPQFWKWGRVHNPLPLPAPMPLTMKKRTCCFFICIFDITTYNHYIIRRLYLYIKQ